MKETKKIEEIKVDRKGRMEGDNEADNEVEREGGRSANEEQHG